MDYSLELLIFAPSPRLYLDPIEVYRSIKRMGWQGWQGSHGVKHPIVIGKDNFTVLHGQLRIMALIMLGYKTVYIGKADTVPTNWLKF